MKKTLSLCVTLFMLIQVLSSFAAAAEINIDLDTASYDEIVAAIDELNEKRIEILKEQFSSEFIVNPADKITFRDATLQSLKRDVDEILGVAEYYQTNLVTSPKGPGICINDPIGMDGWYRGWSVAGYETDVTIVSFVYPVVDNQLIRDDSLAIFYTADYRIVVKDVDSTVADLTEKLSSKYGSPGYNENGRPIWTDSNNNSVYLYVLGNTVHIVYLSVTLLN